MTLRSKWRRLWAPSDPLDVQRVAFQRAEDLLAKVRPGAQGPARLQAYVLATDACPEVALRSLFEDRYRSEVVPAWTQHLVASGLDRFETVPLAFEVVGAVVDAPDDVDGAALERDGIVVLEAKAGDSMDQMILEVAEPSLLENHGRRSATVTPDRPVFIGRSTKVMDAKGALVRRNHLAFGVELSAMSRLQAEVRYEARSRRYVLQDGQRVSQRTQVLRDGQPVEARGPLPTPLQSGDLLSLPGGAVIHCH